MAVSTRGSIITGIEISTNDVRITRKVTFTYTRVYVCVCMLVVHYYYVLNISHSTRADAAARRTVLAAANFAHAYSTIICEH